MNDDFYIGYLPQAPRALARHLRSIILVLALGLVLSGGLLALVLPSLGDGFFAFGQPSRFSGQVRCAVDGVPRLVSAETEYLLVGLGKRGAVEICGVEGATVELTGTLIAREGRQLIEVERAQTILAAAATSASVPGKSAGTVTLRGEIVDSKCYFGVMNPAEGRVHRACATLCLRGGVPAVFVARDRSGAVAHLLMAGPEVSQLLRWAGEPVEATGELVRQGNWWVWRIAPGTLHGLTRS